MEVTDHGQEFVERVNSLHIPTIKELNEIYIKHRNLDYTTLTFKEWLSDLVDIPIDKITEDTTNKLKEFEPEEINTNNEEIDS